MDRFSTAPGASGDASRPRVLDNEDPFQVPQFPNEDVYLYVKHIDNSRVLREADPAARKTCWRLIGASFSFAVLLIVMGAFNWWDYRKEECELTDAMVAGVSLAGPGGYPAWNGPITII